jgi:hypothetical protein
VKSLTAPATIRTQRRDAAPIYLLQIDFTAPSSKTLYLSDRYITALGHDYLALVKDWGTLEEALNTLDPDGRPQTAEVTLFNATLIEGRARLSDLIRTPRNNAITETTALYGSSFWSQSGLGGYDGAAVNNGNLTVGAFHLDTAAVGSTLTYDAGVGQTKAFSALTITLGGSVGHTPTAQWSIECSDDGAVFTRVARLTFKNLEVGTTQWSVAWGPSSHRFWRLLLMSAPGLGPNHNEIQFTEVSSSTSYEWAFAKVTVTQLFEGLSTSDAVRLGVFYLEDPTDIGENVLTVRMTDQSLALENAMQITQVTRAEFPSCAIATVGTSIPRPFGVLKNVPAVPVVDGVVGILSGAHTAVQTTITLVDATDFATGNTILVDTELITLGTKSGSAFTGSTRAANSTTAAEHADLAAVFLVRSGSSAYRFVVGEHDGIFPIKSVSNILVNGKPPRTSPSTTLDATDIVAGKHFATINFTPPDVGEFHTLPIGGIKVIAVTALTVTGDGATNVASATRVISVGNNSEASGPTSRRLTWKMTRSSGVWAVGNHFNISRSGSTANITGNGDGVTSEYNGTDVLTYSGDQDESIFFTALLGSSIVATLTFVVYEVTRTQSLGSSTSTANRVIGTVTCDVEGIRDDVSGTISGTPSLLLENPADVTRFMLSKLFAVTDFGSTWTLSRAALATAGYKWAATFEFTTFSALRRKLGEQARSVLYIESGNWEFAFLSSSPTAQVTLDYTREVWDGMPARVSRTSRTDVRNRLTVSSQLDIVSGDYRRVTTVEDLTQPGLTTPSVDTLTLDLVQDAATADALAAYWLAWRSRQRFAIDLVAWWNLLAIDKIDYVAISNHPVLTASSGGALVLENGTGDITLEAGGHLLIEDLVFRVVGKSYLVGDDNPGRIKLRLVEV